MGPSSNRMQSGVELLCVRTEVISVRRSLHLMSSDLINTPSGLRMSLSFIQEIQATRPSSTSGRLLGQHRPRRPISSPRRYTSIGESQGQQEQNMKHEKLNTVRYFDAAININNPSLEVYNEVSLLNKAHESVDLLLSLGTGNAKGNTTKAKHSLQSLQRELRDISDLVHHKIVDASKKASFSYYRWDVQGGLQDVRLDEWKPTSSGQNTRDRIERATVRYLSDPAVVEQIRECASTLVNARMLRAQTMRWESYATGTRYRCPIKGCQFPSLRFQNRNELMDHLQTVHGKAPPDAVNFQEIQTLLDQGRTNSE